MKGNFSRNTFDAKNHFSQVLMQQGRVTLDADYNEQTAILLHYLRTLARDLIGPYAAPIENAGFALTADDDGIWIGAGRYYVDGLLVENDSPCLYTAQKDYPLPGDDPLAKDLKEKKGGILVYLDVWERHVTALEMDAIREKALGGPDTCSRARIVWQVRALQIAEVQDKLKQALESASTRREKLKQQLAKATSKDEQLFLKTELRKVEAEIAWRTKFSGRPTCETPLGELTSGHALLAAQVEGEQKVDDACITSPDSKYRGTENQLYRVEIHRGGTADEATFKWSRDNGSAATAWLGTTGNDLGVSNAREFSAGNWVELSDDIAELQGQAGVLVKLTKVEAGTLTFDPSILVQKVPEWSLTLINPKVRRWDQIQTEDIRLVEGAVPIKNNETAAGTDAEHATWINLEDGVQIAFAAGGDYRTGDYWLIPARVASGNIEWPPARQPGQMSPLEPHGVVHHYAPLGFVGWTDDKLNFDGCHCEFKSLSSCFAIERKDFGAHPLPLATDKQSVADLPTKPAPTSPMSLAESTPLKAPRRRASKKAKQEG